MSEISKRKFELSSDNELNKIDYKSGKAKKIETVPLICERIKFYREKSGKDQRTLAKMIGVTGNSVSNWENGRSRPDINLLPAICRALDITLYDLFGMDFPKIRLTSRQKELIEGYERLSSGHQYTVDKLIDTLQKVEEAENCPDLRLLMYFSRSLAAGTGDPTEFETDAEPVYAYMTPEVARADSIFRINGDSMEPDFHDGQDVLVQRIKGSSDLESGEIGAFIIGNETYIKKYETDGLHSLNPDYPVMQFKAGETVYLIGRVVGILDPAGYAVQEDIDRYRMIHDYKKI